MNIAIACYSNNLDSQINLRFGRSEWFFIYDNISKDHQFISNTNDGKDDYALKLIDTLHNLKCQCVIAGDFGQNAQSLLNSKQIQMIIPKSSDITVQHLITKFNQNK